MINLRVMMLELQTLLTEAGFEAELDYQKLERVYGHTLEFEAILNPLKTEVTVLVHLGDDSLVKLYAIAGLYRELTASPFNKLHIGSYAITTVLTGKERSIADVFNSLSTHYSPI